MIKSKKIFFGIILIVLILIITGCIFSNKKNFIKRYIKSCYGTENFTIVSQKKVDKVKDCGRQDNKDIYEYVVKSNDTDIEFLVVDTYEMEGYCVRSAEDNYKIKAMEKYIEEFGDNRISLDEPDANSDDIVNIKVDYNNFNSIDDLAKVLYRFKKFYEIKKPFITNTLYFYVHVYIYESETYINEFTLSSHDVNFKSENITESTIYNSIEEKLIME